jgi:hypothetical protein
MAERWQMPFASSRGYGSLHPQYDVARMLKDRHAGTGNRASSTSSAISWVEALSAAPVDFIRLVLIHEQVNRIGNGRLRQRIEVKPSDSRSKGYVEQYGDRCWEADILSARIIERDARGQRPVLARREALTRAPQGDRAGTPADWDRFQKSPANEARLGEGTPPARLALLQAR